MRNVPTLSLTLTPGELDTLAHAIETAVAVYRDQDDQAASPDAPFPDPEELRAYRSLRRQRLTDMSLTMRQLLHDHIKRHQKEG